MKRTQWLLLALSLPYLLSELAFTSKLIDFLGDRPTNEQIADIEYVGRTLTGVAVALWLLPLFMGWLERTGVRFLPVWLGLVALICVGVVAISTFGVRRLVERGVVYLTDKTDAAQRRRALLSQAAIRHMKGEHPLLLMNHQRLADELRKSLEGKVVLAGLPFLLANVTNIEEQLVDVLERVLSGDIRERMGSEERLYNETFVRLMQEVMAPLYEGYARVSNEYAKAKHGVTAQADAEWENYVSELRRRNLSPYAVAINARLRRSVSDQLRPRVPGAPPNWVPEKPDDFDSVLGDAIDKKHREGMAQLGLPSSFPQSLSFREFLAQPEVLARWREKAEAAISDRAVSAAVVDFGPREGSSDIIFPAFAADVYGKILADHMQTERARLRSSIADYVGQSELAGDAYQAMKVVVIIPIAIFLSILGAIGHLGKVSWLAARAGGLPRLGAACIAAGLVGVPVALAARLQPPVGERPEIRRMLAELSAKRPPKSLSDAILKTTINLQAYAYPVGSALAAFPAIKTLLRGPS